MTVRAPPPGALRAGPNIAIQRSMGEVDARYGGPSYPLAEPPRSVDILHTTAGALPFTANKLYFTRVRNLIDDYSVVGLISRIGGPSPGTVVGMALYELAVVDRCLTLKLVDGGFVTVPAAAGLSPAVRLGREVKMLKSKSYAVGFVCDTGALANALFATIPGNVNAAQQVLVDVTQATGLPTEVQLRPGITAGSMYVPYITFITSAGSVARGFALY